MNSGTVSLARLIGRQVSIVVKTPNNLSSEGVVVRGTFEGWDERFLVVNGDWYNIDWVTIVSLEDVIGGEEDA